MKSNMMMGRVVSGLLLLGLLVFPLQAQEGQVSVEQLRSQALAALREGDFGRSNEILARAASLSRDPVTQRMSEWVRQFDSQRKAFAAQRQAEHDKEVAKAHLLIQKGKSGYAIDYAAKAHSLALDKKAFAKEPWVTELVKTVVTMARGYEADQQWLKAMRIYSDLGAIEPANPQWKERLKTATRRIRLLAVYAPDVFKQLQETEAKEREEVDLLVKPTTRTTRPASRPSTDEEGAAFRIDWRETLRGVRPEMLRQALRDAVDNYYRDVSYRQVGSGGLRGWRVLLSTPGLEKAFAGLADATAKARFTEAIDEWQAKLDQARIDSARRVVEQMLDEMLALSEKTIAIPQEVLVSEFADGALAELDPFSNVMWPYDWEEFQRSTKGEFSGVGIQIQSDDDGSLKVVSPLEDTPAYKARIRAGDIITHINGKKAKGISINQAVKQITGPPNTRVMLTVRSADGTVRDINLIRQTIKVQSVKGWLHKPGGGWDYFLDNEQKIAYLRLSSFTQTSANELDKALEEIQNQGAKGLILDLRYNPGGLLAAATEISDRFIERGVLVSTRPDRPTGHQRTRAEADPLKDKVKLPMVVLVNQYSASASEIVSGALKDHKRAVLVGERTFGKGSVQMLFPLEGKKAFLKLTTSHYYLPSDRCIHREENSTEWGVDPDMVVEMTPEQMRATQDARQEQDVLRDATDNVTTAPSNGKPTTRKDILSNDGQLGAAMLVMRMQLVAGQFWGPPQQAEAR
jgi:carboxyl-terminal processing protease